MSTAQQAFQVSPLSFVILPWEAGLPQGLHYLWHFVAATQCHFGPHCIKHGATIHLGLVPEAPHGVDLPHGLWPLIYMLDDLIPLLLQHGQVKQSATAVSTMNAPAAFGKAVLQ